MEKTNKKNGLLLLMAILFIVFQTASIVFDLFEEPFDLAWTMESILMAIVCILMYASYRAHVKNVMKPLLGATLMLILYYNMDWACFYIEEFKDVVEYYSGDIAFIVYIVTQILLFVTLVPINVMHYVINATHHSSPKKIALNKAFYILFAVFTLAQCVCSIFMDAATNDVISMFAGSIADLFMLAMVIIIESSLDEFRLAREATAAEAIGE